MANRWKSGFKSGTGQFARDDEAIAVEEDRQDLLASLLDQLALALERSRLEREARDLAAFSERDRVRSTRISSIGQDLEPPIASIENSVRELRRSTSDPKAIASVAVVLRAGIAEAIRRAPANGHLVFAMWETALG